MKAELIDSMGSDLTVVDAARVSFAKKSEWESDVFDTLEEAEAFGKVDYDHIMSDDWMGGYYAERLSDRDSRLIQYLARHKHWTPFSHVMLQFRITAPIFVARQWYRHTVGFARNEESRRYIRTEPSVFYPDSWRSAPEGSIKQGSGGTHKDSYFWKKDYENLVDRSLKFYNKMIADGVAPEQARMILPQGVETSWVETASLYAYARLCNERVQDDAQKEIRDLAVQVDQVCKDVAPVSWEALRYE